MSDVIQILLYVQKKNALKLYLLFKVGMGFIEFVLALVLLPSLMEICQAKYNQVEKGI